MTTLPTSKIDMNSRFTQSSSTDGNEGQTLHNMNVRANVMRRRGLSAGSARVSSPRVLRRSNAIVA